MPARKTKDKVIAHFLDGTLLRGTTSNFYPSRAKFVITDEDGESHKIHVSELKALFFVREFKGRPEYRERKGFFTELSKDPGNKVLAEFYDGELIFGYTKNHSKKGNGFFVVPGDPKSNNVKVFVVYSSTKRVKVKQASSKPNRRKKQPVKVC